MDTTGLITNLLWTLFLFPFIKTSLSAEMQCVKQSSCQCAIDKHKMIDLSYLANEVKIPPRFANVSGTSISTGLFFYHPCVGFQMGSSTGTGSCQQDGGVAVCQQYNDTEKRVQSVSIGKPDTAEFQFNSTTGMVQISYSDVNKSTIISLNCAPNLGDSILTVDNIVNNQTYYMTLTSRCSCPNGCVHPKGLSVGSILIILFTVGVFVYLIGGMIYQYCICGATGLEIIPNYDFWTDFPLLVYDGVVFVLRCCRTEPTYDRI